MSNRLQDALIGCRLSRPPKDSGGVFGRIIAQDLVISTAATFITSCAGHMVREAPILALNANLLGWACGRKDYRLALHQQFNRSCIGFTATARTHVS